MPPDRIWWYCIAYDLPDWPLRIGFGGLGILWSASMRVSDERWLRRWWGADGAPYGSLQIHQCGAGPIHSPGLCSSAFRCHRFHYLVCKFVTEELRCRDQDRIIQECCTLLGCDRASLFIVDQKTGDLLLQLGKDLDSTIRVPKGSGVAGYVATTGESTNIVDAY